MILTVHLLWAPGALLGINRKRFSGNHLSIGHSRIVCGIAMA